MLPSVKMPQRRNYQELLLKRLDSTIKIKKYEGEEKGEVLRREGVWKTGNLKQMIFSDFGARSGLGYYYIFGSN